MRTDRHTPEKLRPSQLQARRLNNEDAITEMFQSWQAGDREAAEQLMWLVYDELHLIAGRLIPGQNNDTTLSPTTIVSEIYLKLEDRGHVECRDRAHFFALAARMMRQVLVDHCRARGRLKRGGEHQRVPLEDFAPQLLTRPEILLELDEALRALGQRSPRLVAVVELRYFGGLTTEEIGICLGIAPKTVTRDWRRARAWLYRALEKKQVP